MITAAEFDEYMAEVREQVCKHCIERPPGGPPCAPLGKRCGIEMHLADVVEIVHNSDSRQIEPYIAHFHDDVCSHCANRTTSQCPCPLDYLLPLAIAAIEDVDRRRGVTLSASSQS